jgi:uncharacterized membrane protein
MNNKQNKTKKTKQSKTKQIQACLLVIWKAWLMSSQEKMEGVLQHREKIMYVRMFVVLVMLFFGFLLLCFVYACYYLMFATQGKGHVSFFVFLYFFWFIFVIFWVFFPLFFHVSKT